MGNNSAVSIYIIAQVVAESSTFRSDRVLSQHGDWRLAKLSAPTNPQALVQG
jgi:hypothetical protein